MKVLVTVGTTKFDQLISAIDNIEILNELIRQGFKELIIQKGSGNYHIQNITNIKSSDIEIKIFELIPSIQDYIISSDLIICHAGAGSIFEGLNAKKKLIVVPNEMLMHNHQVELGNHMMNLGYLLCASPENLLEVLKQSVDMVPKYYEENIPDNMVKRIDKLFDVKF